VCRQVEAVPAQRGVNPQFHGEPTPRLILTWHGPHGKNTLLRFVMARGFRSGFRFSFSCCARRLLKLPSGEARYVADNYISE
jgi:hypothetical protein